MDDKTYITAELLKEAASDIGIDTDLIFTEVKETSEVSTLEFGGVETKLTKKVIDGRETVECQLACYPGFYSEKIKFRTRDLTASDGDFLTNVIYNTTLRKVYSLPWVVASVVTVIKMNIAAQINYWLEYQDAARFVITRADGSVYSFDVEEGGTSNEGTAEFVIYDYKTRKELLRTTNQYDIADVIKQLRLGIYKAIGIEVLD